VFDDSSRRMRLGMFLHSQAGVDWLADSILRAHLGFLALCDSWSDETLLTIRYEDLCTDQPSVFVRLSAFLRTELPDAPQPPSPRKGSVSEEARRAFAARVDAFVPYLQRWGYRAEVE